MNKKLISIVLILFILLTIGNVSYGANYGNKFVSIQVPDSIERYYSNIEEESAWESFDRYTKGVSTYVHYDVYKKTDYYTTNHPVYTKADLNATVSNYKKSVETAGDSLKIYYQQLIELNGCRGMRFAYKRYDSSLNQSYYIDQYFLLSDHYEYELELQSTSSTFIESKEEKAIINSFKIKDTVNKSRGIPFIDVPSNSWYENAVKYVYNKNIIKGANEYTFLPNDNLTRGQLVTILHRMEGQPNVSGKSKFSDVQNTKEYYYTAVKWASKNNIVNGYSNGKFGPNDQITREQLAVMLENYCRYKGKYKSKNVDLSKYKDSNKISSYAKYAMNWAIGNGVITGSEGRINPQGKATRAEAASMLYKYCTNIK